MKEKCYRLILIFFSLTIPPFKAAFRVIDAANVITIPFLQKLIGYELCLWTDELPVLNKRLLLTWKSSLPSYTLILSL